MTEETLFNKEPDPAPAAPAAPVTPAPEGNPLDKLLAQIVTEDGKPKYRSAEDALAALQASQDHIKRLEAENADFRTNAVKSQTTQEILDALKERGGEPAPAVNLSKEVTDIVLQTLSANDKAKAMKVNTAIVIDAATKLYGDKVEAVFYGKAKELGFDRAGINELSANNPQAVLRLLGLEAAKPATTQAPGVRTDGFQHNEQPAKSAMNFSSSKDLTAAWQESKARTNKRLGIQ